MNKIIETHAHIYDEQFDIDREIIIQNAKKEGVAEIWMPNCDSETLPRMMQCAQDFPEFCIPMFGLHPCYVKENYEKELQIVEQYLSKFRPLAIGEIGIDLFWDKTFFEQQKEAFTQQCYWALKHNLWIDIHSRNAFWETIDLIESIADKRLEGIFHCFVGNLDEARKAIELGFLLGIGGVVTFKNGGLDKILPEIDLKNIVIETDAPYLAPVPNRGKRNEPAYLNKVVEKLAEIYHTSTSYIIEITTENAIRLKEKHLH